MNAPHIGFIVAAYLVAAAAVIWMIASITFDYRALKKALARFPDRDAGEGVK